MQGESEFDVRAKPGLISYYWTSSVSSSLLKGGSVKTRDEPAMGTALSVQTDCSGPGSSPFSVPNALAAVPATCCSRLWGAR